MTSFILKYFLNITVTQQDNTKLSIFGPSAVVGDTNKRHIYYL